MTTQAIDFAVLRAFLINRPWAMLTASTGGASDHVAQIGLRTLLDRLAVIHWDTTGITEQWGEEPSFLAFGISRHDAVALGRLARQSSIIWHDAGDDNGEVLDFQRHELELARTVKRLTVKYARISNARLDGDCTMVTSGPFKGTFIHLD